MTEIRLKQLWLSFMRDWVPQATRPQESSEDEIVYVKPTFFDFMQWLSSLEPLYSRDDDIRD